MTGEKLQRIKVILFFYGGEKEKTGIANTQEIQGHTRTHTKDKSTTVTEVLLCLRDYT